MHTEDATGRRTPDPADFYQRIGELTRSLHNAMRELGYDKKIEASLGHMPDAKSRLSFIARVTGDAAQKVLDTVDASQARQADLLAEADRMEGMLKGDPVGAVARGEVLHGEPIEETEEKPRHSKESQGDPKKPRQVSEQPEDQPAKKLRIKLRDGKEREIQHMISTSFWSADGKPLSIQEFMDNLFGAMPEFFRDEEELRKIWSDPRTRQAFLDKIAELGYGKDALETLQKMIDAEDSDLFDVLSYVSFLTPPITREERVSHAKDRIYQGLGELQQDFLGFVLGKYEESGVDELGDGRGVGDGERVPVVTGRGGHDGRGGLGLAGGHCWAPLTSV